MGKLFDSLEPDEDADRISLLRRFEIERLMTSVLVGVGTFWIILAAYAGEPYVVGLGMLVALGSLVFWCSCDLNAMFWHVIFGSCLEFQQYF